MPLQQPPEGEERLHDLHWSGLQVSDYRKRMPARMRECFEQIFALYEQGAVRAPRMSVRPLDGFAQALAEIRDRKSKDRIVLTP